MVGEEGGNHAGWWLGGDEAQKKLEVEGGAGGEQAMDTGVPVAEPD